MLQILRLYVDILLLRRSAADLPYSPALLLGTTTGVVLLNAVLASALPARGDTPSRWLLPLVVVLMFFAYRVLLGVFGQAPRYVQTMTAMMAVTLLLMPIEFIFAQAGGPAAASPNALRFLLNLGFLALVIYDFYVTARILATALERPVALAMLIVIGLQLAVILLAFGILGERLPGLPPAKG